MGVDKMTEVCYEVVTDQPIKESFSLFVTQICLIFIISKLLEIVMKLLRLPRFIPDILAGFLISILNKHTLMKTFFPENSMVLVETLGQLGLVFFVLLPGVRIQLNGTRPGEIKKIYRKSVLGILLPMGMLVPVYYLVHIRDKLFSFRTCIIWSLALTITGFHELTQDLKALHSDNEAGCVSQCDEHVSWIILSAAISIMSTNNRSVAKSIMGMIILVVSMQVILNPLITKICRSRKDKYDDKFIFFIICGSLVAGFVADCLGCHSMIGVLTYGVSVPRGKLTEKISKKLRGFVQGIMLPMFFCISGMRIHVNYVNIFWAVITLVTACIAKYTVKKFLKIPISEGQALSLRGKGVIAIILLDAGWETKVLSDDDFSIMLISLLIEIALSIILISKNPQTVSTTYSTTFPRMWCKTMGPRIKHGWQGFWDAANKSPDQITNI